MLGFERLGGCILGFGVLQQGRVGEVLFTSIMDSPRRERATTSLTLLVRCVRSERMIQSRINYLALSFERIESLDFKSVAVR